MEAEDRSAVSTTSKEQETRSRRHIDMVAILLSVHPGLVERPNGTLPSNPASAAGSQQQESPVYRVCVVQKGVNEA